MIMHRHFVLVTAALAFAIPVAIPTSIRAQGQVDRDRARAERERLRDEAMARREGGRWGSGTLDTVVAFDARGAVTITCPAGDVVVTTGDRAEIHVRARTEGGAIRFSSNGTRATLEAGPEGGCNEGRFEIQVPAGARVTANSWSGSISVRGVGGDVEARAQSGDVEAHDVGGRLDVESLSGNLSVTNVKGDASLRTVSGDVAITGAHGAVEVETVSGDLMLRDIRTSQLRTHTTSGDVIFAGTIAERGRYEFATHSGTIRLELPAGVGAQLSVSTFSGTIDSEFPITLRAGEHGIGAGQAKHLTFTLGQGSARIVADTFSGDITLSTAGRH
jgi:DUF4097 and DUF4098 domain-containing protein YvlB